MNRRNFLTALAGLGIARDAFGTPQQDADLLRLPYLQNTQRSSTSIVWASTLGGEGSVEFTSNGRDVFTVAGSTRGFRSSQREMPSFVQYQADLSGLAPNTNYAYRVMMDGGEAARGDFRTAGTGPFKFVVIGDSGQGTEAQRLIARRIARERPAFLLHAGDLAYFTGTQLETQWNHFGIYRDFMSSVPFFPCPGNHEYMEANARPYLSMHVVPDSNVPAVDRGRYYSFDWGNLHVVSLDSNASLLNSVRGAGQMLRWLEADLQATQQFLRVAMIHHPPYGGGPNQNDLEVHLVRTHVVPILEKYGVQLVFSGHEHSYQRTENIRHGGVVPRNTGTSYIISGGAGSELYPTFPHPFQASALSEHHFLKAEVSGASMNLRAIRPDGVEIDEFTLSPLPLLADADPTRSLPMLVQAGSGTVVRISGQSLAMEAGVAPTDSFPLEMAGTSVSVNGSRIPLLSVSNSEVYGYVSEALQPPFLLEVRNANGPTETIVRE